MRTDRRRVHGVEDAPDLRGENEAVTRHVLQHTPQPHFADTVTVQRGRINVVQAQLQPTQHRGAGIILAYGAEQAADGSAADAESRDPQAGAPNLLCIEWVYHRVRRPKFRSVLLKKLRMQYRARLHSEPIAVGNQRPDLLDELLHGLFDRCGGCVELESVA